VLTALAVPDDRLQSGVQHSPHPASLLGITYLLTKDKVTAKEFLIACAFPIPCIFLGSFGTPSKKKEEVVLFTGVLADTKEISL